MWVVALCKLSSQIELVIMPSNVRPAIIENIVQFSHHGVSQREKSRITGVLQSVYWKVLHHVYETNSLAQGLRGYRLKASTSKENRAFSVSLEQVSLSARDQSRTDEANWTLCLYLHWPNIFISRVISFKTSRQMPQTKSWPSSTLPHVGTEAPNWNHLHCSHLIFADESKVTP